MSESGNPFRLAKKTIFTGRLKTDPQTGARRFVLMKIQTESIVVEDGGSVDMGDSTTLLLPRIATASLPAATEGNAGMLVFDTTSGTVKYSDGSQWVELTAAA